MFYTQAWAKPTYVGTRLNHERRHISSMAVGVAKEERWTDGHCYRRRHHYPHHHHHHLRMTMKKSWMNHRRHHHYLLLVQHHRRQAGEEEEVICQSTLMGKILAQNLSAQVVRGWALDPSFGQVHHALHPLFHPMAMAAQAGKQ